MSTETDFFQQVRDALNHLYDYGYLEKQPLARLYWPEESESIKQAQRLHRLLLESIEELHPPAASNTGTSRAEYYLLLVYRYIEERPLPDIMQELGYSRRQFFRQQQKATEMLASILHEKVPAKQPPPESNDHLEDELERFRARRRAIDPLEALKGTLEIIELLAEQHHVSLTVDLPESLPLIYGSRTVLRQVFLNSLSCLISQPHNREVHLHASHHKSAVIVEITAKTDQTHPAEPAPQQPGSIYHLVKLLGGTWSTEKLDRRHYVWQFKFPANVEKTLLVVEDNEGVINAFRRYLVGYNYRVISATTGAEAIQLAQEVQPSIITLDVMIPGQDGWEILHALKRHTRTKEIPVVICSVLQDPTLAHSLGAAAYLRKPVVQTDLLTMLDRLAAVA
ncbi:MAG: response regulator [Anaerolineae bacterium]|nr:response regulator [Anaerolineae bacterium]